MNIADLSLPEVRRRLRGEGLSLDCGLVRVRVRGDVPGFAEPLRTLYAAHPLESSAGFHDVTVRLSVQRRWRERFRPHVQFLLDGDAPFDPLPAATHLRMFEWGLNWCVASRCHRQLLLHAGVVAREGLGVLIPALPGSGKITLTAALAARGYRLLSDEFGALRPRDLRLLPLVRPVSLKNESIAVMRRFAPEAVIGPTFRHTRKDDVAHVAPTALSVAARHDPATPALIVFPQFRRGASPSVEPVDDGIAFIKVSGNSFNYELLGERGFEMLVRLIQCCRCYRVTYGDLDDAVAAVDDLLAQCVQPLAVGQ